MLWNRFGTVLEGFRGGGYWKNGQFLCVFGCFIVLAGRTVFFRATGRGAAVWGLWRNWSGFVVFFHKNLQKLVYVRKKV